MSTPFSFFSQGILPTDLPRLYAWYRADQGVTLNGGDVSVINDIGNYPPDSFPHNLSQTNAAKQPLFVNAAVHGNPAIQFTRANADCLQNLSNGWATRGNALIATWSILFVAKKTSVTPGNAQIVAAMRQDGGVNPRWAFGIGDGVGAQGWYTHLGAVNFPEIAVANNTWITRSYIKSTTEWNIYQNGVLGIAALADAEAFDSIAFAGIGNEPNNTVGLEGSIAEVLIFDAALSNAQRLIMEDYLRDRYDHY